MGVPPQPSPLCPSHLQHCGPTAGARGRAGRGSSWLLPVLSLPGAAQGTQKEPEQGQGFGRIFGPGDVQLNELLSNALHIPSQPKAAHPNTLHNPLCFPEVREDFPADLDVSIANSRLFPGFQQTHSPSLCSTDPGRSRRAGKCLGGWK